MKRPLLHREYLNAIKVVEEYHLQIKDTELWMSDLSIDIQVRRNYPESQVYWVSEVNGQDVLIRTTKDEDAVGCDDFWVNISELRTVNTY